MNSLVESEFPLHETQRLRYDLVQTLTDAAWPISCRTIIRPSVIG